MIMNKHILLFFALLSFVFVSLQAQDHPKPVTLEIGASAPDFSLPGIDGKNYSLKDFEDYELLTVIFSCNHCPTAQAYEDRIIALVNDYKSKGVGFVMISPNDVEALSLSELGYTDVSDGLEDMKIRARDKGYNFPYLFDGDTQETSIAYGPVATPHMFVFDKQRKLQYVGRLDKSEKPGTANAEDVRNAIDEILQGQPATLAKTKTFGCSVKWAWKGDWKNQLLKQWAELPVSLEDLSTEGLKELMANKDNDKLRLVNAWATWCGPCIVEFPSFIEMDRMYRDRNFEFISLSFDRPQQRAQAEKMLNKWQASNKNYILNSSDTYNLIDIIDKDWNGALPYTALIAPDGEIVWKQEGTIDPLELKRAIVDHELMGRVY